MQNINQKATPMSNLKSILNNNGPHRHQYKILDGLIESLQNNDRSFESLTEEIKGCDFLKDSKSLIGHVFNKPYGYAGDFEIIDRLYTYDVSSEYYSWDKYILNTNAVKAVQNRKTYFKRLVLNRLEKNKTYNLLNIASGPARDLKEVYDLIDKPELLQTTCIDMDANAIKYAKEVNKGFTHNIDFVNKNVLRYNTDKKFDLVWSAGLFDYFDDRAFLMMLKRMKEWVSANGEIVVGNFNENNNPTRPVMEVLGEWHLHHRSQDELTELAIKAGFNREQISVGREPENVNLFLHIKC